MYFGLLFRFRFVRNLDRMVYRANSFFDIFNQIHLPDRLVKNNFNRAIKVQDDIRQHKIIKILITRRLLEKFIQQT
jgi:hypothetical protein